MMKEKEKRGGINDIMPSTIFIPTSFMRIVKVFKKIRNIKIIIIKIIYNDSMKAKTNYTAHGVFFFFFFYIL